jgi:hypothetical protein
VAVAAIVAISMNISTVIRDTPDFIFFAYT